MVPIHVAYQGQLRNRAVHGPSRVELVTDAPTDNQGRGESFSPTDLVATGLATCLMTIMGIVARRDGYDLDGMSAEVEKHMSAAPPRRIARIVVRLRMPAGIAADRRVALERAARSCPVALSLHPELVQELEFSWG
ncbi:MAG: OsmC family protein [Planctomycetes bacterium]|nr:OsmC family protein [Planctomycetota bacterium]